MRSASPPLKARPALGGSVDLLQAHWLLVHGQINLLHDDQELGGEAGQTIFCHTLLGAVLENSLTLKQPWRLTMPIDNFAVPEQLLELEHGWISPFDGNPTIPSSPFMWPCAQTIRRTERYL
jgi:hypothetical protein